MRFTTIIILIAVLVAMPARSKAQIAYTTGVSYSMDTDIRDLRNEIAPSFHSGFDDYLQYAPAAVMLGMKAFGYESRTRWDAMLVSDVFSAVIMTGTVKGIKYIVHRQRPDIDEFDSFPSGHTATAFMAATLLHKEYGWRSPLFSLGGYAAATATGLSRLMNNRHWMSDVVTGAAIGIGSVHLGYYLTDLIFKDRHIYEDWERPVISYDGNEKHYVAELLFGRRFILGGTDALLPTRGSFAGIQTDIPLVPGFGITARAATSSLRYDSGDTGALHSTAVGGYWNLPFAKLLEFQARATAGCAWQNNGSKAAADLCTGIGLSLIIAENFKIKGYAEYEGIGRCGSRPWMNTINLGYSAAWFW